jgi:hypothetical protein
MKPICKIAGAVIILFLMFIADIPNLSEKLVPEAQAFRGRGAAFAVGAAVGSASSSSNSASTSQQQAATSQQQAAKAQQQSATAQQQAAASSGTKLPLGTVVSALPAGCAPSTVGGVNYYYCGENFYQAMYQGSTLVYVTTQPK